MKKLFVYFTLLFAFLQLSQAQPVPQDTSDIIWQKYIWPQACGDAKFSADGNFIYAVMSDSIWNTGRIVKLSALTGDSLSTFQGRLTGIDGLQTDISALGNYIVTKDYNNKAMLWDVKNEKLLNNLTATKGFLSNCIAIDPQERYIINGEGVHFTVYDPVTLQQITSFLCTDIQNSASLAVKFSHDGTKFAIVYWYEDVSTKVIRNSITLWETGMWKQISEIFNQPGSQLSVFSLKFSYNDSLLAYIRAGSSSFVFDINSKYIIKTTDLTRKCYDIDYLPDNYHWFFYYHNNVDDKHSYELYNYKTNVIEKTYQIYGGTADYDINTNQLIVDGYYWLTLLKPTITGIQNPGLSNENLNINEQSGKLTIELSTVHNGNAEIIIYNLLGNNIYQQNLGLVNQGISRFSINNILPVGIYICKVQIGDYSISQKFQIGK